MKFARVLRLKEDWKPTLIEPQKEIGIARGVVTGLQGQRNVLQGQRNVLQGQRNALQGQRNTLSSKLAQVRGQRQNARRGINTLRATTRNLEQRRLASNRVTNNTFNASAAFNQQLKSVAARQRWKSLKPKATMIGASQMGVGKALRQKLLKNIDVTNLNGKHVVDGLGKGRIPLPGGERRDLKKEVQDPMTGLNRLRAIEKMILDRKTNRNSKILSRKRMNQIIAKRGTANRFTFGNNTQGQPIPTREQVTFGQGFARSGRSAGRNYALNTRSRTA